MESLLLKERRAVSIGLSTFTAFIRLFSPVNSESLTTLITLTGFLCSVNSLVANGMGTLVKHFATFIPLTEVLCLWNTQMFNRTRGHIWMFLYALVFLILAYYRIFLIFTCHFQEITFRLTSFFIWKLPFLLG